MKLLKQREKEEEMLKRVEENMRAKVCRSPFLLPTILHTMINLVDPILIIDVKQVDKLAKKMQQQSSNMRRQSEVPLTQVYYILSRAYADVC